MMNSVMTQFYIPDLVKEILVLELCRTATNLLSDNSYALTNPVNPEEDLTERVGADKLDAFRKLLAATAKRIENFAMDSTEENLSDVFGYRFPHQLGHERERSLRSSGIYFDCDYADKLAIGADSERGNINGTEYTITVNADHQNHPTAHQVIDRIVFHLKDYLKKHHVVKWQVMNDPSEVGFEIRGEIYDTNAQPNGFRGRSETINWAGKHWVRAFVMENDRCKHISSKFKVNVLRAGA